MLAATARRAEAALATLLHLSSPRVGLQSAAPVASLCSWLRRQELQVRCGRLVPSLRHRRGVEPPERAAAKREALVSTQAARQVRRYSSAVSRRQGEQAEQRRIDTAAAAPRRGGADLLDQRCWLGERCRSKWRRYWRRRADKRGGVLRRLPQSSTVPPRQPPIRPRRRPSTPLDERVARKSPTTGGIEWSSCGGDEGKGPEADAAWGKRRAGLAAYRIPQLFGPDQLKFGRSRSRQTVIQEFMGGVSDPEEVQGACPTQTVTEIGVGDASHIRTFR